MLQDTTSEVRPGSRLSCWCFLLLTTAVLYRAPLWERAEFESWDQARVYVPLQVSNARQRAEGEIPLWFQHGFLGYPMQGETECSGVYPPTLIFNLVEDPGTAWSLFLLTHQLIAIGGMLLLLKTLGAGPAGQTLAAMVFVLGGTFVGELPQATLVTTLAWLPLIAGLMLSSCRQQRTGPAWGAGIALGVQVSGGHPQIVFYTLLLLGLVVLCEFRGEKRWQRGGFALRGGLLTLALGLGLAAPQIWYCLETMQLTDRWPGLSYEEQMNGSLPPHYLVQLLLPGISGNDHRLQILFTDLRVYVGLLTLPLLLIGWRHGPASARGFRWALPLALLLALGRYSGLFLVLGQLPGFSSIHVPARFLMIASLAIAVLAGLGLDHLQTTPQPARGWKRSSLFLAVVATGLLIVGLVTSLQAHPVSLDGFFRWGNTDAIFLREWRLISTTVKADGLFRAVLWGGGLAMAGAVF